MDVINIRKQRGKELRLHRESSGLNKSQLSILSGLTRPTIDKIENGTIGWNIDSEIIYFETIKNHKI